MSLYVYCQSTSNNSSTVATSNTTKNSHKPSIMVIEQFVVGIYNAMLYKICKDLSIKHKNHIKGSDFDIMRDAGLAAVFQAIVKSLASIVPDKTQTQYLPIIQKIFENEKNYHKKLILTSALLLCTILNGFNISKTLSKPSKDFLRIFLGIKNLQSINVDDMITGLQKKLKITTTDNKITENLYTKIIDIFINHQIKESNDNEDQISSLNNKRNYLINNIDKKKMQELLVDILDKFENTLLNILVNGAKVFADSKFTNEKFFEYVQSSSELTNTFITCSVEHLVNSLLYNFLKSFIKDEKHFMQDILELKICANNDDKISTPPHQDNDDQTSKQKNQDNDNIFNKIKTKYKNIMEEKKNLLEGIFHHRIIIQNLEQSLLEISCNALEKPEEFIMCVACASLEFLFIKNFRFNRSYKMTLFMIIYSIIIILLYSFISTASSIPLLLLSFVMFYCMSSISTFSITNEFMQCVNRFVNMHKILDIFYLFIIHLMMYVMLRVMPYIFIIIKSIQVMYITIKSFNDTNISHMRQYLNTLIMNMIYCYGETNYVMLLSICYFLFQLYNLDTKVSSIKTVFNSLDWNKISQISFISERNRNYVKSLPYKFVMFDKIAKFAFSHVKLQVKLPNFNLGLNMQDMQLSVIPKDKMENKMENKQLNNMKDMQLSVIPKDQMENKMENKQLNNMQDLMNTLFSDYINKTCLNSTKDTNNKTCLNSTKDANNKTCLNSTKDANTDRISWLNSIIQNGKSHFKNIIEAKNLINKDYIQKISENTNNDVKKNNKREAISNNIIADIKTKKIPEEGRKKDNIAMAIGSMILFIPVIYITAKNNNIKKSYNIGDPKITYKLITRDFKEPQKKNKKKRKEI